MILLLIIVGTVCFLAPYTTAFNREYSHSRFACLARNARNRRPLSKGRHSGKFHDARDELLGDSGKKKRKNFNKSKPKPSPKYTSKLMSLTRDVLNSFFSNDKGTKNIHVETNILFHISIVNSSRPIDKTNYR